MRTPPENETAPEANRGGKVVCSAGNERRTSPSKPRGAAQALIASIDKSHSCQLRVSLSSWRSQTKVEIADFTAVTPGIYFQAGAGVTLPINKLPELIKAIVAAEREAIARGLIERAER